MISCADPFGGRATRRSLARLTTARVGGMAARLVEPRTAAECVEMASAARKAGLALRVLGGGTNILALDGEMDGVVLSTRSMQSIVWEGPRVRAGAGVPMGKLVRMATDLGHSALSPHCCRRHVGWHSYHGMLSDSRRPG